MAFYLLLKTEILEEYENSNWYSTLVYPIRPLLAPCDALDLPFAAHLAFTFAISDYWVYRRSGV